MMQDLPAWSSDVEGLSQATNGLSPQEVFHRCDQPTDLMPLPQLKKECREDENCVTPGLHPKWTYPGIDSYTPKDSIVGELKGKISHMQNYIQDLDAFPCFSQLPGQSATVRPCLELI